MYIYHGFKTSGNSDYRKLSQIVLFFYFHDGLQVVPMIRALANDSLLSPSVVCSSISLSTIRNETFTRRSNWYCL